MHTLIISVLYVQSIRKLALVQDDFLMYALSKYKLNLIGNMKNG